MFRAADGESGLRMLRQALKGPNPAVVLQLPKRSSQEDALRTMAGIRNEVDSFERGKGGVQDHDLLADVKARVELLQEKLQDPMEAYILMGAVDVGESPEQPRVRMFLEEQFLRRQVSNMIWYTASAQDPRRSTSRAPIPAIVHLVNGDGTLIYLPMENISRTGIALREFPTEVNTDHVLLQIELPKLMGEPLRVKSKIMWRGQARVGIRFEGLPPSDADSIEMAIRSHYERCLSLAERFYKLAPNRPEALACVWQSRFFSLETENERKTAVRSLREAARQHNHPELWLALAKVTMAAGRGDLAEASLERARTKMPRDKRVLQLDRALTVEENDEPASGIFTTTLTGIFRLVSKERSVEQKRK